MSLKKIIHGRFIFLQSKYQCFVMLWNHILLYLESTCFVNFFKLCWRQKSPVEMRTSQTWLEVNWKKVSELDFLDKDGNVKATIQSKYYQSVKELDVIRTTSCHVLVVEDKDWCNNCSQFRKPLNIYKDRLVKRDNAESVSRNTPISTFSRPEIEKQCLNLQKEKKLLLKVKKGSMKGLRRW